MSNNKELLKRLSEIVDGLSEENYEKSMAEMQSIFDKLQRNTESLAEIEKIFGYDDILTKQADLYLAGNPSSIDGMKMYLKNSLGMIEPMNSVKPETTNTHVTIKELPNGQKAAVITKITSEISPEAGEEMVKLVTGEISEPSEVQKVDAEIKEILSKKDSIDPENFSEEELKIYNKYMNNFSEEAVVEKRGDKEFPIIDTTIEKDHPLTETVGDLKECFENMEPDQAAFALAKIGSQTRVEVSDALFAEIYSDTNEECKNFASTALVYGTELERAGEILNSLFSEEGSDTNFSEVEQELYNRYTNNFSYMENELNNDTVNFSEEEVAFANQFSENELIELLNYSDEELVAEGVPEETVEVISSIRDKVADVDAENAEEISGDEVEEETEMSGIENFANKAELVREIYSQANFADPRSSILNRSLSGFKKLFADSEAIKKYEEAIKTASETKGKIGKKVELLNDYKKAKNLGATFDTKAKRSIAGNKQYVKRLGSQYQRELEEASKLRDKIDVSAYKNIALTGAGVTGVGGLGVGGMYLANNSNSECAPEVLAPEQAAQVVDALSQKLADADLSKEEASKVLVEVEDKVSPEIAEAVQADVLKEIDARFSEVVENLEITPEEVQAAEEVIDSAIEEVQKERAGEAMEKEFSAYGVSSFNKYCANFAWAESVIDSIIDGVKAEKVAEPSPAAESEEAVKEAEAEVKEVLPVAKTDEPTSKIVTTLPENKTDEPTLSKEDAVSNFSAAPVPQVVNSEYASKMKRSLGF